MASINIIANITSVPCLRAILQLHEKNIKMRGGEIEPNRDHPLKHIVGVQAGSPPILLLTRFSKLQRFVKTPWEGSGISRNVMPECVCQCVCLRAHAHMFVCSTDSRRKSRGFLHMLVAASAFKDWAPTRASHQTQPARRNEIPIIFN